jgi:hypothetical protein
MIKISNNITTGILNPQYLVREISQTLFDIFHIYDLNSSIRDEK